MTHPATMSRVVYLVAVGVALVASFGAHHAIAFQPPDPLCNGPFPQPLTKFETYVRFQDINYKVQIRLNGPAEPGPDDIGEEWSLQYYGLPRCICPNGHKTHLNRGFDHWHNQFTIPAGGRIADTDPVIPNMQTIMVTPQMIEAFWDWEYTQDGFQRVAGTGWDVSQNCYGYAMDLGTWGQTQHMGIILADDWVGNRPPAVRTMALTGDYGHCARIQMTMCPQGPGGYTAVPACIKATEKFRDSPIYERAGTCMSATSPKMEWHFVHGTNDVGHVPFNWGSTWTKWNTP